MNTFNKVSPTSIPSTGRSDKYTLMPMEGIVAKKKYTPTVISTVGMVVKRVMERICIANNSIRLFLPIPILR